MSIDSTMHNHRGVFIAISAIAALTLVVGCMPDKKTDDELAKLSKADAGTSAPTDSGGGSSTTTDTGGGGSSTASDTGGGGSSTTPDTSGGGGSMTPADTRGEAPFQCTPDICLSTHPKTPACGAWKCVKNVCKTTWLPNGAPCKTDKCQANCKCIKLPKNQTPNCLPPKSGG